MKPPTQTGLKIREAYRRYTLANSLRNSKVACVLVMLLMPAGYLMDRVVFQEEAAQFHFLWLRLLCSGLAGLVFLALNWSGWREPTLRVISAGWYLAPSVIICVMVAETRGLSSTYYAGLNLVILAVSSVIQATLWESIVAVGIILTLYILACAVPGLPFDPKMAFNNGFFLLCTSAIVITGNYYYSGLRFREFALRFELDKSKNELEESNQKLSTQNVALANANQEIRAAEMQLVQSEKLASLGRFSAGLMHDVLNPLNYSRTGTFTLRKKCRNLPPEMKAEFEAILTDVEDGLKRVDNIVSDLRTFTHPGGQAAEDTDIAEVLNMALRFVSSELTDKNFSVDTAVAPGQKAWISRNHMILVLVNLLENAIDALEDKQFPAGETPVIHITGHAKNGRSFLRVRDNGPGIDPQHLSKVFDPFYTTKDVGKGTGLGLSICFGILRGYSGDITVASEPGKFCAFTLELPCDSENVTPTHHAEPIRL